MAVLKLNNVTTLTESSGALTLASSTLTTPTIASMANCTFPAGMVIKVNAFNDQTQLQIAAGATGGEVLDVDFTAQATNSAYYFGCTMVTSTNDAGSNSDRGDRGVTCWLEDSSAANKYRFGYRKTTSNHHTTMVAANDYYALADSDSGIMCSSAWNESHYSWSWVAGNQPTEELETVVNSAFGAGDTITLRVWLASNTFAIAYNKSNYSSTNNGSRSVFSIIEVAT